MRHKGCFVASIIISFCLLVHINLPLAFAATIKKHNSSAGLFPNIKTLEYFLPFSIKTYITKPGDSLSRLADYYNISLLGFRFLNSHLTDEISNIFPSGQMIILPRKPLSSAVSESFSMGILNHQFDDFSRALAALSSKKASVKSIAQDRLQGLAQDVGNNIRDWANQYGTARIYLGVLQNWSPALSLDFLLPVIETQNRLLFSQFSTEYGGGNSRFNFGVGFRYFSQFFMLGINGFVDYRSDGKYLRYGGGFEVGQNNLKFSMNAYFAPKGRIARKEEGYEVSPTSGFDVQGVYYFSSLPFLGVQGGFEKYFGFADLDNNAQMEHLIRDPYSFNFGMIYTPVPLLSFHLEQKFLPKYNTKARVGRTRLGLQATYRLGVPLLAQITSDNVALTRQISNNRYDLVSRNHNIILAYEQKLDLQLYDKILGGPGEEKPVFLKIGHLPKNLELKWDIGEHLFLSKACETVDNLSDCRVRLPGISIKERNSYVLGLKAYQNGQEKFSQTAEIIVDFAPEAPVYQARFLNKAISTLAGQSIYATVYIETKDGAPANVPRGFLAAFFRRKGEPISYNVLDARASEVLPVVGEDGYYNIYGDVPKEAGDYELSLVLKPQGMDLATASVNVHNVEEVKDALNFSVYSNKHSSFVGAPEGFIISFIISDKSGSQFLLGLGATVKLIHPEGNAQSVSDLYEVGGHYFQNFKAISPGIATFYPVLISENGDQILLRGSKVKVFLYDAPQ